MRVAQVPKAISRPAHQYGYVNILLDRERTESGARPQEITGQVVGIARRVEIVEEKAKKLVGQKGKLYAYKADFSKEEDIVKTFKWVCDNVGTVYVLVNNAGVAKEGNLMDGDSSIFKAVLDLNVLGLTLATREAVKIMKANNINGHIVHINSVFGHSVLNFPGTNIYPASKYAVTALTETLRQELARIGSKIRVTSISPGLVESELTTLDPHKSAERIAVLKKLPILKPEDIAEGVVFTLSTPEHVQVHEMIIKPTGTPS